MLAVAFKDNHSVFFHRIMQREDNRIVGFDRDIDIKFVAKGGRFFILGQNFKSPLWVGQVIIKIIGAFFPARTFLSSRLIPNHLIRRPILGPVAVTPHLRHQDSQGRVSTLWL